MNKLFTIDAERFISLIRSLSPGASILERPTAEDCNPGGSRNLDVLMRAALEQNPNLLDCDMFSWPIEVEGCMTLGLYIRTKPLTGLTKGFTELAKRKKLVLKFLTEEIAIVRSKQPNKPTYVYLIRGSREIVRPAILGFENLFIVELPQVDMWNEAGIEWILEGKPPLISTVNPGESDTSATIGFGRPLFD